jgi:DNA-binding NarL/FixJ family response regulator
MQSALHPRSCAGARIDVHRRAQRAQALAPGPDGADLDGDDMTRVLIADDHPIFRQGLLRLLSDHLDLTVVAQAGDGAQVIEALRVQPVDVLILDLSMPGRGGVDLIAQAKAMRPGLRVLVVTMHGDEPYITQALRAGADGYVTKEGAADEVVVAIHRIAAGGRFVCSTVAERLALRIATQDDGEALHTRLSERELRIFELLVAGKRGWEIARELSLSEKTVSTHKAHVLSKMQVTNRTELVLYAVRHGLMSS